MQLVVSVGTTLPLALQPTVAFGLPPSIFFTRHPISPSSLPALEGLFLLPLPTFSWVFPFTSSLPVLE